MHENRPRFYIAQPAVACFFYDALGRLSGTGAATAAQPSVHSDWMGEELVAERSSTGTVEPRSETPLSPGDIGDVADYGYAIVAVTRTEGFTAMTVGKLKAALAIVAALALAATILLVRSWAEVRALEARPPYKKIDQDIVDQAFRFAANENHAIVEEVQDMKYASVMYFPGERCVQLSPLRGVVGGRTIYCFSLAGNRLTDRHALGE